MDVNDEAGVSSGQPSRGAAPGGGAGGEAAADFAAGAASSLAPEREIDELKFLIGTACSRLINLLIDPRADPATLGAEAAFVSARTARLSELLAQQSTPRTQ
jgi:hypothetical protein